MSGAKFRRPRTHKPRTFHDIQCPVFEKPAAKLVFLRVIIDFPCVAYDTPSTWSYIACVLVDTLLTFFETLRTSIETPRTFVETVRTFTVTPHKGFEKPLKIAKLMRYAAGIES